MCSQNPLQELHSSVCMVCLLYVIGGGEAYKNNKDEPCVREKDDKEGKEQLAFNLKSMRENLREYPWDGTWSGRVDMGFPRSQILGAFLCVMQRIRLMFKYTLGGLCL